jgi:hypothetical protein
MSSAVKRFPDYDYYGGLFKDQLTDPQFVRMIAEWFEDQPQNGSHCACMVNSLLLSYASLLERTSDA